MVVRYIMKNNPSKIEKEPLMTFSNTEKDIVVDICHDEREEGIGYYVDFRAKEDFSINGCVYYSDDLNNAIIYAKSFSENYNLNDIMQDNFEMN